MIKKSQTTIKKHELADEELDNVSGGTTYTTVDGVTYPVVTSENECPTGDFYEISHRECDTFRRDMWYIFSSTNRCGHCSHLEFHNGLGYCSIRGNK